MFKEPGRIILPIDGSDQSKKAAIKGFSIAKSRNINVYAIHIIHQTHFLVSPELLSPIEKMMKENANKYLNEIEQIGEKVGLTVEKKIIRGTPYEEIIKFAKKEDLIVMGNKGKTDIERILIGSVAEKVIRHAPCDILIVKTD